MEPARTVHRHSWRAGTPSVGSRSIPEEIAVAVTYNGGTYAVMMMTPQDLEDFALGFSLSEGVIGSAADIGSLDIVHLDDGVELRVWLSQPRADRLKERRRHMAGPTGCGLCGIESIAEAMRPTAIISQGRQFSPEQIMAAMEDLPSRQRLNIETRAVHAGQYWTASRSFYVDDGALEIKRRLLIQPVVQYYASVGGIGEYVVVAGFGTKVEF